MYGNILMKWLYYDYEYDHDLENNIPNENSSSYNNIVNNETTDFMFINNIEYWDRHFSFIFISVYSNSLDNIELMVTSYNYFNKLIPEPNLKQFFVLNKNLDNKIKFNYLTQNAIMINIASLYGKGELYFNNKLYNLEEKNNKISLFLNSNVDENIIFKIKNQENMHGEYNFNDNQFKEENKIPEFVFYIEYYYRNSNKYNIDKIKFENISEIIYKKPVFPLYIYSEIENYEQDINIYFKFNRIMIDDLKISSLIIDKKDIIEFIENKPNNLEKLEAVIDLRLE